MVNREKIEAEQIEQQKDVKLALKQSATVRDGPHRPAETRDAFSLGTYVLCLIALGVVRHLLNLRIINLALGFQALLERFVTAGMLIILVLAVFRGIDIYIIARVDEAPSRFNVNRVLKLIQAMILAIIAVSIIFVNWYAAIVSIGLISLTLGFALQNPITSFIGWIYILVRTPYTVGDRIQIGDATGDVIDVSYLDTTLWEFGGPYLSTDHPSGRIIKFPNSKVLSSMVYNYSWPIFPYIWNEVKIHVAYESDLEFLAHLMRQAVEEELGEKMRERVRVYREVLGQTPVDELDVREHPSVIFRLDDNTFVDAIVRYLVHPKEAGRVKNRLVKKLLTAVNAHAERVRFPKGDTR